MKAVSIDERRIASRMALVDEHAQAEMDLDLERTLATLNEAPDYKINDNEFSGRESVRAFYADMFTGFPDLHLEITRRYVSDEAIIIEGTFSGTIRINGVGFRPPDAGFSFHFVSSFPLTRTIAWQGSGLILTARSS